MVFQKARGWLIAALFSIVGTTVAIQFDLIGPAHSFLDNLIITAIVWIGSRAVAYIVSRH